MNIDLYKKDVEYMMEALREADSALEEGEVPIGCVIVAGDKIIARGHNLTEMLKDPTAHAEMQAITSASYYLQGKYLSDCTLYVTVEPCPMCASALYWARIGRVVYGCKDPKRGATLFGTKLYHPKTEIVSGILQNECAALMQSFFAKRRK